MPKLNELTANTSGGYPDRVASLGSSTDANMELVQQLVGLQMQQRQLQEQSANVPGVGDHLKSLPGILAMLGTGAATAAGGQQGSELGAALMGGFVKGASGAQAEQQASLAAQQKQTQDIVAAQQQRLTTLLQSRPEMFVDPATGESYIDPRLIGFAATGYMMPINPGVNYRLTKQTERDKRISDLGISMMKDGATPDIRRQGALITDMVNDLHLGTEFYEAIMGQDDRGAWNSILGNDKLDQTYSLEAYHFALTNNLTLDDPRVVGMLRKAEGGGGELTMDKYTVSLIAKHNQRMVTADPSLLNLPIEEQIKYTMGDEPGSAAALIKFYLGQDAFGSGVPGSVIVNAAARDSELARMIFKMDPTNKVFADAGITTEDQIWQSSLGRLQGVVADYKTGLAESSIQNYGLKLADVTAAVSMRNPGMSEGEASSQAYQLMEQWRTDPTVTSALTKITDVKAFNAKVDAFLKEK